MPKMVLGKTPQELEAEKAKRIREQEAEIQQSIIERQKKIQALHAKQKSNKIIIIISTIAIVGVLVTFGTYNTFFKQGLTMDEVNHQILAYTQQSKFPSEGLDNFVRDNCEVLFKKYMSINNANAKNIESISVDKDSCHILKLRKLNSTLAEVYFSVDISVKDKDSVVTDPVIIEQLKRNGFGNIASPETTTTTTTTITKPKPVEPEASNNSTESNNSTINNVPIESTPSIDNTTHQPAAVSLSNSINFETSDGEIAQYYLTSNGKIVKVGKTTTTRYNFYLPVEYKYYYDTDGKTVMYGGYVLTSDMNLYSLVEENQTNFDDISIHPAYKFDDSKEVDEKTLHDIHIRVDKTLDALYSYKNTEAEYKLYYEFNTYDAEYNGITNLMSYSTTNQLGYNTHVTYTITTKQGFSYTLETYMLVEPDGNSWVIKKIM